jgi:hypothetical protein
MKPQSLQDAIKDAALKNRTRRESGGWQEPLIKKHQISAEEFSKGKTLQTPMTMVPQPSYSSGGVGSNEIVQKLDRERNEFKKERDILLTEMKGHREEMEQMRQEMNENRSEMEELRKNMVKMRRDMTEEKQSRTSSPVKAPSSPIKMQSSSAKAPFSPAKSPAKGPAKAPFSPVKGTVKSAPLPPPYTTEELFECQRSDDSLREFMQSKTGLPYKTKHMSIEILDGNKLMYFKNRVYIPVKLRKKTVKFYCGTFPNDAKATLRENCIWPEMDEDVDNYLNSRYD